MNGVHDMGGMHGFGPVNRDESPSVFHAPWTTRGTPPVFPVIEPDITVSLTQRRVKTTLKAAVVAGLLAGFVVAAFHLVLIEPIIDRAIQIEEQS